MSLIGDIIIGSRDLFPDPCQSLNPPSSTVPATNTNPVTLFPGAATVYMYVTQGNQWGETSYISELNASNPAPFNVTLTVTCSYLATFIRVYFTTAGTGQEDQYVEYPITTPTNSVAVNLTSTSTILQGVPPAISRAWLPDSDGNILSAARLYLWLHEGRQLIGNLTGGIRDVSGVPSVNGQGQYQTVHDWISIDNNFYDGYPIAAGTKQQVFRHSKVTGLSGVVTVNTSADRQIIELWPQAQRTAGSGTTSLNITSTATTIPITSSTGFVLNFGLILLGTYPPTAQVGTGSCELIYFSNLGSTSITQVTRGLGGTFAQAWSNGTPFQEVNVYFTGKRFPQKYTKGQSTMTVTDPPGFVEAMKTYLLYRFKDAEQNVQEAQAKYQLLVGICNQLMKTQQPNGPRQVMIGGQGGVEVGAGLGGFFGGVIIP